VAWGDMSPDLPAGIAEWRYRSGEISLLETRRRRRVFPDAVVYCVRPAATKLNLYPEALSTSLSFRWWRVRDSDGEAAESGHFRAPLTQSAALHRIVRHHTPQLWPALKPDQPGCRGPLERVPSPLGRALACVRGWSPPRTDAPASRLIVVSDPCGLR
jgi:hypothetical protein